MIPATKRIAIIGSSGSGKSTFANKLGKVLNRSVIHLDKEYYTSGWKEKYPTKADWIDFQRKLIAGDEWIIDGNYRSSMIMRLDRADAIIFFDFPKWFCLWRAFKRIFNRQQPFDKPEGMREKISWELIRRVITYPTEEIYQIIKGYKDKAKIIILKNNEDVKSLLNGTKVIL
jgi:adenylate kinase family enzyme